MDAGNDQAERIVGAMNAIHGAHAGRRAVHAKGSCCRGTFVATPDVADATIASHLQGQEVPVTVRFSNGSGRPTRADGARDERGMAVKFHLADGATTDLVSLTLPVFFVRNPEDFLTFLETQRPDPDTGKPDLEKVAAFVSEHPETQKAIGFSMLSSSPASFANCTFHGIHAFRFEAKNGDKRFGRYRWIPAAGEGTLSDEETRALGRDYLHEELERRLQGSAIVYDLEIRFAVEGDDPSDPTTPWSEENPSIRAGRLTLTDFGGAECDAMIFDPGRLTAGIEPSDDLILKARSPAYSVSFARRNSSGDEA
jgi:catalase